jgi:glycosyltransferase involved in cell wall biosynthesis
VDDQRAVELYANARAVAYAPVDEDYGFTTVEAFMSARPVVTTEDAGGVLEFVASGENGLVTAPDPTALAAAIAIHAAARRAASRPSAGIRWSIVL